MTYTTIALLIIGCALGVALSYERHAWKVTTHFITLVHELGHAFIGLISGSKIIGIKLNMDSSGVTASSSPRSGYLIGRMLTLLAGYTAPMVAASGLAWAGFSFGAEKVWLAMAIASAASILFMRNMLAFGVSIAFAGVSTLAYLYAPEKFNAPLLSALLVLMFIGGLRRLYSTVQLRKYGQDEGSDMQALRTLTLLPVRFWEATMYVVGFIPLAVIGYFTFIH